MNLSSPGTAIATSFTGTSHVRAVRMADKRFPELRTERLDLCEITRDHADWYLKHFSIPEIAIGQGFPPPADLEAAKRELELYIVGLFEKGNGFRWGIRLRGGTDIIGSVGFHGWDKEHDKSKMGYDLRPEYWGRGIMTEALERTVRFGFEEMGLNRIEVNVLAANHRSTSVARRLGFVHEGVLRDFSKIDGIYIDEHLFSLLRRDWQNSPGGRGVVGNPAPPAQTCPERDTAPRQVL